MNFTNLSLLLNQYPILKAKKKLKQIHAYNEEEYEVYIKNQKKWILNYHLTNNNFYKAFAKGYTLDWNSLPVLTKSDLQIPLDNRLSNGYSANSIFKNKTSGSTGNPFYFGKDKFSHALTWAVIDNRFSWHNLSGKRQARFYGLPKKTSSKFIARTKDFLLNRFRFEVFDLSKKSFENWLKKFEQNKFVYLNGYTSVLVLFAKYLIDNKSSLKLICPSLKACVVTSEMLLERDKEILENAFGIPIINEYGASELDLIAFENNKSQWVLNTETLYIEVLDDDDIVLPDGEIGNLVITSLYNKAHPFIRYKIGDKGAIKKINSKLAILEKLEGRIEDKILLPSGKISPGLTFYYVTKSVMEDSGNIKEIKVIQNKIDSFIIEYVSEIELTNIQIRTIKKAIIEYLEPNLFISFIKMNNLERSNSGKLKQFTSLLKD